MKLRLAAIAALALCSSVSQAALTNGGFEQPVFAANNWYPVANIPGWTASPGANIEVWAQPFGGFAPYEGNQFVELNSNVASTIYQDITTVAGQSLGYAFAHRGRNTPADVMNFKAIDFGSDNTFGTADDVVLVNRTVSDGTSAWGYYNDRGIITTGHNVRLSFTAVNPQGSLGNFLDAVRFDAGVPEPTALALVGLGLAAVGLSRRRKA